VSKQELELEYQDKEDGEKWEDQIFKFLLVLHRFLLIQVGHYTHLLVWMVDRLETTRLWS